MFPVQRDALRRQSTLLSFPRSVRDCTCALSTVMVPSVVAGYAATADRGGGGRREFCVTVVLCVEGCVLRLALSVYTSRLILVSRAVDFIFTVRVFNTSHVAIAVCWQRIRLRVNAKRPGQSCASDDLSMHLQLRGL